MAKKIRLMQITHDLAIGGLQQVIVNLCRTIDKNKFDVSVLCLRDGGEFLDEVEEMNIKVYVLPQKSNGVDYFAFLKVAKILRQENIDIIHTHNTQPFIDGTIGAIFSNTRTLVHTDHARNFPDKKRYMFAEWLMSKYAYKVVGVSEHTSQNLVNYEKISKNKIITIPNGIDESIYNIKINKDNKKKELGIDPSSPVIGLGVRLTQQKGITYLLKAMTSIISAFPDITLLIAGQGESESELKNEAKELGVDKNIRFIGPRMDMPEILKILDLYVLPSIFEGLPMVLLEAMAAGCPIVATDVGGNSMAVIDGKTGVLVETKRPQLLADAIIRLLNDPELRDEYAKNAYERFKAEFTVATMTTRYENLYSEALSKPNAS